MQIDSPDDLDAILTALGDPTRRAILDKLSTGPARVTEIAAPFSISLNSVSKHIRILERANLVLRFRSGREHILTFNPAPLEQARDWLTAQQGAWIAALEKLDAALTGKKPAKTSAPKAKAKRGAAKAARKPAAKAKTAKATGPAAKAKTPAKSPAKRKAKPKARS